MKFDTRVNNIPCICHVIYYFKEPFEWEFTILDRKGYRAEWLDKYIDHETEQRLLMEYLSI